MSTPQSESKRQSFTPRELRTPSKEEPGLSKTAYDHASAFSGYLNSWERLRKKGTTISQSIVVLRLQEDSEEGFPKQLSPLMDSLVEALNALNDLLEGLQRISKQYAALSKLCRADEPLINTWSAAKIAERTECICKMYQEELSLKKSVTENIAHCRDENLMETYASSWEFEPYIKRHDVNAFLVEMGLEPP